MVFHTTTLIMNMNAAICVRNEKGIRVIKVDTNGNPAFVGATLYAKYQTKSKVNALMRLGDLVSLGEAIRPTASIGHYVLKDGSRMLERRLQEGVCVSKSRDIRQMDGDMVLKNKPIKPRIYPFYDIEVAYISEGVDYLYLFEEDKEEWFTYGMDNWNNYKFGKMKIDYKFYINNLICRDDISDLTRTEKNKLLYVENQKPKK